MLFRSRTRIELNTPLRNLARGMAYTLQSRRTMHESDKLVHLRVTGQDYAGLYQEQLFYRQLSMLKDQVAEIAPQQGSANEIPVIFYAPLITDWSGAKLSKSLYVEKGAYKYLEDRGMGYLLEYRKMVEEGKDKRALFNMVQEWVQQPEKLFRNYTIEYVHLRFLQEEAMVTSDINVDNDEGDN